ncbi:MAG: HlyD family secretion protein [Verrucomicrobiales bacterium]
MQNQPVEPKAAPAMAGTNIPTPLSARWREFRIRFVPFIVFIAALVACWKLWQIVPPGNALRGVGEGAVSIIASPSDGFFQSAGTTHRGWIKAGEDLLTIVPYDPGAKMDLLQSELQISRLEMEPTLGDRNVLNFERLRIESLQLKRELAMAKANLDRAQKVLPRHETLLKEQLIAQDLYDLSVRDVDYYKAEVNEITKAIASVDSRLEELQSLSQASSSLTNSPMDALLPQFREQVASAATNFNPVTLAAPISGEVQFYRQPGEFVTAGEPLMVINSERADHVVAYLKQPAGFEPSVGMKMEVSTRSRNAIRFETEIAHIGARVEVITNAVAFIQTGALVDSGLPLILPVPDNVHIRPGELLDIFWKPAALSKAVN